mgnify:CR=1 FL=1
MLFNKNENKPASSIEEKIKLYRRQGHIVPPRKIIKNAEQIEGIRESAKINTAVLDHVAANIREGMSTEDINTLVYDFTVAHGAIPAPLNYEGFPKSVCTSINEEVCHGIPDKNIILRSGDIINVDVSTIYNGYFSDASRMFMIGEVAEDRQKLVRRNHINVLFFQEIVNLLHLLRTQIVSYEKVIDLRYVQCIML